MIVWAVVGHVERDRQARALAWMVGAEPYIDPGGFGEWSNHRRAWVALSGSNAEWSVVLQDDAVPVAQIATQAEQALTVAPGPVVSFYAGRSYPPETVRPFSRAVDRADWAGVSWIVTKRLFWGVAVAVRTELIVDMLRTADRVPKGVAYDERLSYWAQKVGGVAYTWPSLVDHADGPSLVTHRSERVLPRKAYRVGTRPSWDSGSIRL